VDVQNVMKTLKMYQIILYLDHAVFGSVRYPIYSQGFNFICSSIRLQWL